MRQTTRVIGQVLATTALAFALAGAAAVTASSADPLESPLPTPAESAPRPTAPMEPTTTAQPPANAGNAAQPATNDCAACVQLTITLCDGSTMTVWAKAVGQ